MARCNAIGRRVIPGLLIVVVDVVVVVVVAAAASALGSRLLVVRVCVGEHHLGRCFQPAPLPVYTSGLFTACLTGTWDLETLLHTRITPASPYLDSTSFGHKYPMLGHSK